MNHPLPRLILGAVSAATAFLAFGHAAFADNEGDWIPPNVGFYDVPNQGPENVPGDFCGGDGSIGDVIPDGMFRAYVTQINDYEVGLDLICVYRTPQDDTIYQVPDGYVTNNNPRVRWMPLNDVLVIHGSAEGHGNMHYDWDVPFDQSMDAWVGVSGGRVHFIVSAPSSYDGSTAAPVPTHPPAPAPATDSALIAPGVIEDGVHFGYAVNATSTSISFDRADIGADGMWTNNNPKVRTLPVTPDFWSYNLFPYPGQPIEIHVQGQRVTMLTEAMPYEDDHCGC